MLGPRVADVPHPTPAFSTTAAVLRSLRLAAVGIGTGVLVAGVVGGIGGRIAMRVLFLQNELAKGSITENGNEVGVITPGGTVSLVFFTALFLGVPAGLVYVVVRRWLLGEWFGHGALYGGLLLVLFGGGAIDADNVDFRLFGPSELGVVLFGSLPFLFGVSLAYLVDRWDPYVPAVFRWRSVTIGGYVVLVGLAAFGVVRFAGSVPELVG